MPFNQRFREIRNDLGYTQKEMAERLGIGLSSLQRYENGTSFPDIRTLLDFAVIGINLHWFITGDGDKERHGSIATDPYLRDIWEWLSENEKQDKGYRDWFRIQFELSFPMFQKWREAKIDKIDALLGKKGTKK